MPRTTQTEKSQSPATPRAFEQCMLDLEDVCLEIREGQFTHGREDIDRLYWQQKLKNLVMPISLALAECKGPRVFHHHYKHKKNDAQTLTPVMESARENLINVCKRTLHECENLNGMKGSKLLEEKQHLCRSLRMLLATVEG